MRLRCWIELSRWFEIKEVWRRLSRWGQNNQPSREGSGTINLTIGTQLWKLYLVGWHHQEHPLTSSSHQGLQHHNLAKGWWYHPQCRLLRIFFWLSWFNFQLLFCDYFFLPLFFTFLMLWSSEKATQCLFFFHLLKNIC